MYELYDGSIEKMFYFKVTPRLKKFARVSLNLGLPIIRPLWMIDSDQSCFTVNDQFSIGDEIIVAPVLEGGKRERDVSINERHTNILVI